MTLDPVHNGVSNGTSLPHGSLTFDLAGPSVEACLAGAVEDFAEAFAEVHPSVSGSTHWIELHASTPPALLLAVLEECLRRGREGEVVVDLQPRWDGDRLVATIEVVAAADAHVRASAPHVVSWHEVSLAEDPGGGWSGRVEVR